ncbi:MAG: aspartate aminotransferase family protein [Deltaproteobacteria bacterium]|nr:aspartate aminotransferase family protein [Deltaproteobacteria bacterium]MBW2051266.1 aspartate aminotransferase family protein [Deltaproteobacteria bacterium]MBW2139924.1 aspartate aminotransferase family protein [Deltaproteobacteria bacterium]MBW2322389.1 aspartate aminotransferase family protein [Deltaproteobacteria bacterium]
MNPEIEEKFGPRKLEDMWSHVLSYHPFKPVLDRAEGIYLYDTDGNRYIDVSGGPIAINLGHGDKRINEAIAKQLEKFAYCHPMLSSQPRAELCERISQITPWDLNTVFPVSGGSLAVETAIKLARQYHTETGNDQKYKIITCHESYHGMTLGALSAAGGPGSQSKFMPYMHPWPHIHQPSSRPPAGMSTEEYAGFCNYELEEAIHYAGERHVAAFMATPVSAGEDYGFVAPKEYWQKVREICDKYNILFIADEVVTGFGRTGKWFCMEHFDVKPDIMITGKGITSLYAPMGAVIVSDKVNEPFAKGAAFVHGFTNQGHPIACAAAKAVIDIIEEDGLIENSAEVGSYLHSQAERLLKHPIIAGKRGIGMLMPLELVMNKETMEFFPQGAQAEQKLQILALKNGLVLYSTLYGPRRPAAHKRGLPVFVFPQICITSEQVDDMLDRLDTTLTEFEAEVGV